jgi:hypothetical protein
LFARRCELCRSERHSFKKRIASGGRFSDVALRRLRLNALGHYVAAAAFAASQPFDEVGDGGARPHAEAYEVAFGDDGPMPA